MFRAWCSAAVLVAVLSVSGCSVGQPVTADDVSRSAGSAEPGVHDACRQGVLALTFDDGPEPATTPSVVRFLERAGLPATFFMIGVKVDAHPGLARSVAAAGFQVGNHTYHHEDLTALTPAQAGRSIRHTFEALNEAGITGHTDFVRPPQGRQDAAVLELLHRHGWVKVGWSFGPHDATATSLARIEADARHELRVEAARPGATASVLLLHDGATHSAWTVRALPGIVSEAEDLGFCFTAVGPAGAASTDHLQVTPGRPRPAGTP